MELTDDKIRQLMQNGQAAAVQAQREQMQKNAALMQMQLEKARIHATLSAGYIAGGALDDEAFDLGEKMSDRILGHWGFEFQRREKSDPDDD